MTGYTLKQTPQGVGLVLENAPAWAPLRVDFTLGKIHYRKSRIHQDEELIKKAVGFKKNVPLCIFDTTAGLGQEAFLLAALGCELVLFERNPTIAGLLKDGLVRGAKDPDIAPIIQRMQLIEQCAISALQNLGSLPNPDVIYCDPMFEARKKTAAVKKGMQILQTVVGEDNDGAELVRLACQVAKKRVVVKRALHAPALKEKPDFNYRGRSQRYDIYLVHP